MKVTRELKTGVFAVIVIALFIWGYNYLKGINLFDGKINTYFTEYNNVQGLNTASVVTINGVEVGKVVNIKFNKDPKKRGQLIVEFSILEDFQFSKKSVAKIYSASLMGGKSLAVVPSYEGEMAKPGDYLKGEIESDIFSTVTEKLNPLQAKVENVIVKADSLLGNLNDIVDTKTRTNIKHSMAQLNETITNFNSASKNLSLLVSDNKEKLDKTFTNAELMTSNFKKISDTLVNANLGVTVKKLQTTVTNLNQLLGEINSGNGSLGKLLKDESLYSNLSNASKELEELLRDMKLHPKRYVHFSLFGKKDKGYKPASE
ncbi:MAG: MlaD family protein [Lutibacter sp.]|uniref:MlaD family protein n=1 Tax=Lutibacter sp. TaxID=1925666 RepID=UPI00299F417F|nr:MlaD family protein [Lutibacter sp.]MDX1829094.1 MlaD family protein [Lutibacter sp.]